MVSYTYISHNNSSQDGIERPAVVDAMWVFHTSSRSLFMFSQRQFWLVSSKVESKSWMQRVSLIFCQVTSCWLLASCFLITYRLSCTDFANSQLNSVLFFVIYIVFCFFHCEKSYLQSSVFYITWLSNTIYIYLFIYLHILHYLHDLTWTGAHFDFTKRHSMEKDGVISPSSDVECILT